MRSLLRTFPFCAGPPPSIRGLAIGRTRPLFTATWSSATRCSAFKPGSMALPRTPRITIPLFMERFLEYQQHATAGRRNADYAGLGPRGPGGREVRARLRGRSAGDACLDRSLLRELERLNTMMPSGCAKRFVALRTGVHVVASAGQRLPIPKRPSSLEKWRRWTRRSSCRPLDSSKPWPSERDRRRLARSAQKWKEAAAYADAAVKRFFLVDDDGGTLPAKCCPVSGTKPKNCPSHAVSKHY